jgi:hypothetical protein
MDKYDEKALRRLNAKLTPQPNGCCYYQGAGGDEKLREKTNWYSPNRKPHNTTCFDPLRFFYKGKLVHPRSLAFALANNTKIAPTYATCGNRLCCKPAHIAMVSPTLPPNVEYLQSIGYSDDLGVTLADLFEMSGLPITQDDIEAYRALA